MPTDPAANQLMCQLTSIPTWLLANLAPATKTGREGETAINNQRNCQAGGNFELWPKWRKKEKKTVQFQILAQVLGPKFSSSSSFSPSLSFLCENKSSGDKSRMATWAQTSP